MKKILVACLIWMILGAATMASPEEASKIRARLGDFRRPLGAGCSGWGQRTDQIRHIRHDILRDRKLTDEERQDLSSEALATLGYVDAECREQAR